MTTAAWRTVLLPALSTKPGHCAGHFSNRAALEGAGNIDEGLTETERQGSIMAQTNVLKLNSTSNKPARQGRQVAARKAAATIAGQFRRQHIAAGAVALLAGSLTFLSVHHLATGYQAVTHCADWEAIISACGIDLGFLLQEIAQLVTVRDATLKVVARWANPAIGVTLAGSAALNSFAFMQGAETSLLAIGAAILMGCFLPGFIYVLTRVSAHLAHH